MKAKDIFDSWKEISEYLERDIRTCHRWEKELGLPVHRMDDSSSRSKIFAYKSEIDKWLEEKAKDGKKTKSFWLTKPGLTAAISSVVIILALGLYVLAFRPAQKRNLQSLEKATPRAFEEIRSLDFSRASQPSSPDSLLSRVETSGNDPLQLYNQGKYFLNKNTRDGNEAAIAFFLKSIQIKEDFPLAYLDLARCYMNYLEFEWDMNEGWLNKALMLVNRAGKSAQNHPEYYCCLAEAALIRLSFFNKGSKDAAFASAQQGLAKFPNHPRLNAVLGECLWLRFGEKGQEADLKKALFHSSRSFWLDPYAVYNLWYAEMLTVLGSFDEAMEVCGSIQPVDMTHRTELLSGGILYYSGKLAQSKAILEELNSSLSIKRKALVFLAMIAAQQKEHEKTLSILKTLELMSPDHKKGRDYSLRLASVYFGLGMEKQGYAQMEKRYLKTGGLFLPFIDMRIMALDPNFNTFRNSPRMQKILPVKRP